MKKMLMILLAMVMLSGCAGPLEWYKPDTPIEQRQKDYMDCSGYPFFIKEGMTIEQYENDYDFCREVERNRSLTADKVRFWSGIAGGIIDISAKDLRKRCMVAKGYRENPKVPKSKEEFGQCMKDKGYISK